MGGNGLHGGGSVDGERRTVHRGTAYDWIVAVGGIVDGGISMGSADGDLVKAVEVDGGCRVGHERELRFFRVCCMHA